MLKQILKKHTLQRPPNSIFIFTDEEASDIINFLLRTFFRHYSLYEYSFKPKIDLILMTMPPEAESKDTKLLEESVNEANAMNEGIQDIDLDAAGAPADGEGSKKDEAGSSHPLDQSSNKPGSAGQEN